MEDWKYLIFQAPDYPILIRYKCKAKSVSADEIEDAISSYIDAVADSDTPYEQVARDVMSSFEDITFDFLPCKEINY